MRSSDLSFFLGPKFDFFGLLYAWWLDVKFPSTKSFNQSSLKLII